MTWRGKWDMPKVTKATRPAALRGLQMGLDHVLQISQTKVPNDEGTLERSGRVVIDEGALTGAVTYGEGGAEPYATVQHERLDFKHPGGRQAKYLEQPMTEEADTVAQIIAAQVRRALR